MGWLLDRLLLWIAHRRHRRDVLREEAEHRAHLADDAADGVLCDEASCVCARGRRYVADSDGGVGRTVHVVPLGDLIEHDTETDQADCECGPEVEYVPVADGPDGWVIAHRALDGRERYEEESDV